MNQKRPINLDMATMKFPPMAIASILHRLSGVMMFLLLPFILYCLHLSLASEASFARLEVLMHTITYKVLLWAFSASLIYHLLAGIRHLLMDLGYGEHLVSARRSAIFIIAIAVVLTIFLGFWIW